MAEITITISIPEPTASSVATAGGASVAPTPMAIEQLQGASFGAGASAPAPAPRPLEEVAVQAADRAQAKGLGTAADYRLAVARRAAAQRDLIVARYEYVNQYAQLLVVTGWTPGLLVNEMAGVLTKDAEMDESKP